MKLTGDPRLPLDTANLVRRLTDLHRDIADQVNALSEGRVSGAYASRTSVPTTGSWAQGDFVRNATPAEAGSAASKYVITGWLRLTSGAANVMNTDWVEARALRLEPSPSEPSTPEERRDS